MLNFRSGSRSFCSYSVALKFVEWITNGSLSLLLDLSGEPFPLYERSELAPPLDLDLKGD